MPGRNLVIALSLSLLGCGGSSGSANRAVLASDSTLNDYVAMARGQVDVEGGLLRIGTVRDGTIIQVNAEEGDDVKAGQALVILDQRQANLAADIARAEVAQARAQAQVLRAKQPSLAENAKRARDAVSAGVGTAAAAAEANAALAAIDAEILAADSAAASAVARLQAALFEVDVRTLRAPQDGRIVRRTAGLGDTVQAVNLEPLFQIAPLRPHIVRVDVDEEYVGRLHAGMHAEIVADSNSDRSIQGQLRRIGDIYGRRVPSDVPNERQDVRVVGCIVSFDAPELRIGQRVLVRFRR